MVSTNIHITVKWKLLYKSRLRNMREYKVKWVKYLEVIGMKKVVVVARASIIINYWHSEILCSNQNKLIPIDLKNKIGKLQLLSTSLLWTYSTWGLLC